MCNTSNVFFGKIYLDNEQVELYINFDAFRMLEIVRQFLFILHE